MQFHTFLLLNLLDFVLGVCVDRLCRDVAVDRDVSDGSRLVADDGANSEIHDGAVVEGGGDRCCSTLNSFFSHEHISSAGEHLRGRCELGDRFVEETLEGPGGVGEDDIRLRERELRNGARAERALVEAHAAERADSGDGGECLDEIF